MKQQVRKKISFVFVKIKPLNQELKQQMVNIQLLMCNYIIISMPVQMKGLNIK